MGTKTNSKIDNIKKLSEMTKEEFSQLDHAPAEVRLIHRRNNKGVLLGDSYEIEMALFNKQWKVKFRISMSYYMILRKLKNTNLENFSILLPYRIVYGERLINPENEAEGWRKYCYLETLPAGPERKELYLQHKLDAVERSQFEMYGYFDNPKFINRGRKEYISDLMVCEINDINQSSES